MRHIAFALALLLAPALAHAQTGPLPFTSVDVELSSSAFAAVTMGSARTFDAMDLDGVAYVTLDFAYTYDSATDVQMSCERSNDSTTWFQVERLDFGATTIDSIQAVHKKLVTTDVNWTWTVNMLGKRYLRCTITATSGTASDLLTITSTASVD